MNKWIFTLMAALFSAGCLWTPLEAAGLRLGVGANYWVAFDDIDLDDYDEDGVSLYVSAQFPLAEVSSLELQLERFEKGFGGSDEDVYSPQAFILLGTQLYAAVGVGVYFSDGEFADQPYYAFRAGLNLELLPGLYVDLNANYRFEDWDGLNDENINEDTIMLGAAARIGF